MGILNLTPDSFFDGGRYVSAAAAERRIDSLIAEGATIIDIGGESSRPGAAPVPAALQIERIAHAVGYAVTRAGVLVSVDTTSPEVADQMLASGAHMINDVSCLADADLARVTAQHGATLIVMHARGPMRHMTGFSEYPEDGYGDVVRDVSGEWQAARERALDSGLEPDQVWFDPGIGFNKNARHSFELLGRLAEFRELGVPIVVGPSRKSFINAVFEAPAEARLGGTIAACVHAVQNGADIVRVHDVRDVAQAIAVSRAITRPPDVSELQHA